MAKIFYEENYKMSIRDEVRLQDLEKQMIIVLERLAALEAKFQPVSKGDVTLPDVDINTVSIVKKKLGRPFKLKEG